MKIKDIRKTLTGTRVGMTIGYGTVFEANLPNKIKEIYLRIPHGIISLTNPSIIIYDPNTLFYNYALLECELVIKGVKGSEN